MKHSIDFFKDEIRNGFYVPTAIKQAWASTLDVLAEIDRICTKYDITYYADWGTLLGAVRHGGFIPWDDDLDICMQREDYIRFREVADAELPEHFDIHDYERHEDHWLFLARVVSNKKMCFDPDFLREHYNFPWLAGVDIFLKDHLYRDPDKEAARDKQVMEILARGNICIEKKDRRKAIELYKEAERVMSGVRKEDSDHLGQIFPWVLKNGYSAADPASFYEKTVRLPFEDTTIPVPAFYDSILKKRYGDYCRIRKVWGGHDYPYFEAQKKEMESLSGQSLDRFRFDRSMLSRPSTDRSGALITTASECLVGLDFIYEQAESSYQRGAKSEVREYFQGSIQLAEDYGTLVEHVKGENSITAQTIVACLEEYCELLYQSFEKYEKENLPIDFRIIGDCLETVRKATGKYIARRREVVFFTTGPDKWNGLRPYYEIESAEEDTDVYVIPLPVMTRDYFGRIIEENGMSYSADAADYPGVSPEHIADYEAFNIKLHAPDRVYIQDPYDGVNPYLTVPPVFYSSELRGYTDELIFVPFGQTSEFTESDTNDIYNMKSYVNAPGVIYSDKVFVQSENIRDLYIRSLTSFAGSDTEEIWKSKVTVSDADSKAVTEPDDKKQLLFCIGVSEITENPGAAEGLKKRIDVIADAEGINASIVLYPHNRGIWKKADAETAGKVFDVIDDAVSNKGFRFLSPTLKGPDSIAEKFDAYYGSPSPYVPAFNTAGKPVMICDMKI